MKTLNENSSDAELVENLGNTDPVYDATIFERPVGPDPLTPAKKRFCKKCALCGVEGQRNEENVVHEAWCPWIWAMRRRRK